jgi:hypothetical protein
MARGDHSILTGGGPAVVHGPHHGGPHPAVRPRTTPGIPPGPPQPRHPPAHPGMPAVPEHVAAGTQPPGRRQPLRPPGGSPRASRYSTAQRVARSWANATWPCRRLAVMPHSWRDRVRYGPDVLRRSLPVARGINRRSRCLTVDICPHGATCPPRCRRMARCWRGREAAGATNANRSTRASCPNWPGAGRCGSPPSRIPPRWTPTPSPGWNRR